MERLLDVPCRACHIARHGVRHGAAAVLAVMEGRSGEDLSEVELVAPANDLDQDAFDERVQDLNRDHAGPARLFVPLVRIEDVVSAPAFFPNE